MLAGVQGRVAVVNTTEASFPFLEALSSKGRVVITATHSAAQKYATVFPDYFVKAMKEASTDLDKNGRTSIFEVFSAASLAVKQHYEQRGQLLTEHALIDDNGDGKGRKAEAPRDPMAVCAIVYPRCRGRRRWPTIPSWRAGSTPPRARAQAEELKLKKGVDAGGGVDCAVREADARARASLRGDQEEILTGRKRQNSFLCWSRPFHARPFGPLHEHHQHESRDEAHHVRPERDAAPIGPAGTPQLADAVQELHEEPQPRKHDRRQLEQKNTGNGNSMSTRECG